MKIELIKFKSIIENWIKEIKDKFDIITIDKIQTIYLRYTPLFSLFMGTYFTVMGLYKIITIGDFEAYYVITCGIILLVVYQFIFKTKEYQNNIQEI